MKLDKIATLLPSDYSCHLSGSLLTIQAPFMEFYVKEYDDHFEFSNGSYFHFRYCDQKEYTIVYVIKNIYAFSNFLFHVNQLFSDLKVVDITESMLHFKIGTIEVNIIDFLAIHITLKIPKTIYTVERRFTVSGYQLHHPSKVISTLLEGSPELKMSPLPREYLDSLISEETPSLLDIVSMIVNQNTELLYRQTEKNIFTA